MFKTMFKVIALSLVISLSACQSGFQTMDSGEYGVVFNAIPPFFGGGVKEKVIQPGEMEFILPWQTVYRVDTSIQSIAWGGINQGDKKAVEDYVETRALDGNEVGLAITLQYHVNPEKVAYVIQNVGSTNRAIRTLVEAIARADIRTHMNILKTQDFFNPGKRDTAVQRVKEALHQRLEREGIIVDSVIYNDHRFERRLTDGTTDRSYQEKIDKTQAVHQQIEREKKRIPTVIAQKERELNDEQARVNREVEAAEGFKRQAQISGDAYFQAKSNEAEQIKAVGMAEVEGLKKQIAALSGPGGEALLRLTIAKALIEKDAPFVLLNNGQGSGNIDFNRVDSNELIRQLGIVATANEGMGQKKPSVSN